MMSRFLKHWRTRRLLHRARTLVPSIMQRSYGLPQISLDDLLSGDVDISEPILEDVCMPRLFGQQGHDDLTPMLKIVRSRQPKVVVELGTAHGTTTANICRQAPEARVFTVNSLPSEQTGKLTTFELGAEDIGRVYRNRGYGDRVVQIFCNTLDLDLGRYLDGKKVGLAIIDACHDVEYVCNDFHKVLPFLDSGAIVLLHDTHPSMEDHLRGSYVACMKLRRANFDVKHLAGTWWAIYEHP